MTRFFVLTALTTSVLFFLLTAISLGQKQRNLITFQFRTNEKKQRQLHYLQDYNYLKVKTNDSTYYLEEIYAINDSSMVAACNNRYISIPLKNIRLIKKGKDFMESMGTMLLWMDMIVGIGVSAPYRLANKDKDGAVNAFAGTASIAAILSIPIIIGNLKSRHDMKKWKIISFTKKYSKE